LKSTREWMSGGGCKIYPSGTIDYKSASSMKEPRPSRTIPPRLPDRRDPHGYKNYVTFPMKMSFLCIASTRSPPSFSSENSSPSCPCLTSRLSAYVINSPRYSGESASPSFQSRPSCAPTVLSKAALNMLVETEASEAWRKVHECPS